MSGCGTLRLRSWRLREWWEEEATMIMAELRGKAAKVSQSEDVLTSNVFGTLKNIDRSLGLKAFLQLLEMDPDEEELEKADFSFWEKFKDRTEPDVIIRTPSHFILVEAKYLSALASEQLEREFKVGKKTAKSEKRDFYLVAVTSGFAMPDVFKSFSDSLTEEDGSRVKWTSWQEIGRMVEDIANLSDVDVVSKRCAEDLWNLLDRKNLRGFRGFEFRVEGKPEDISVWVRTSAEVSLFIAEEVSNFVRTLRDQLQQAKIVPARTANMIERDGRVMQLETPPWWVTTYYGYPMVDERWKETELRDAFLFLKLFLDTDPLQFWVGCALARDRQAEKTPPQDVANTFFWNLNEESMLANVSLDTPAVLTGQQAGILLESYLVIYRKHDIDELDSPSKLPGIMEEVIAFRDQVPDLTHWLAEHPKEVEEPEEPLS